MKQIGSVNIPQEAFVQILKSTILIKNMNDNKEEKFRWIPLLRQLDLKKRC